MMKKLLSLPPNLADCFFDIENLDQKEWFCSSDPIDKRLGSGGGTVWLLDSCRKAEGDFGSMHKWLQKEKRIIIHAGGQSRRLPSYAPSGKILTPIPIFRWERGQKLNQKLIDLQLPLYEEMIESAPKRLNTLIASGDVYIRTKEPLQKIPDADVVCYGMWVDASLAKNHGVFVSQRTSPEKLDFMIQKPSIEQISKLGQTHLFLMDIGVWLLSDRAIELLIKRSKAKNNEDLKMYDLYSDFGLALGNNPQIIDEDLNKLSVAILSLNGGEFYHYGTSKELLSSTLAVQNLVRDQRVIMHQKIKPHPSMFIQNAEINIPLTSDNYDLWVENSYIGKRWNISNKNIITGIPTNDWEITIPESVCLDIVPIGEKYFAVRPYGFADAFRGAHSDSSTTFMERPFNMWAEERGLNLEPFNDIQDAGLFPVLESLDEIEKVLHWMINDPLHNEGKTIWIKAVKLSANDLLQKANLLRLAKQREEFYVKNWPLLVKNYDKSVFYQLDLKHAANVFTEKNIQLPLPLTSEAPLMKRIHNHMFRSRVQKLSGVEYKNEENNAFALLSEGLTKLVTEHKQNPKLKVYKDQIVWGRSPVRIDLAGGWTDTPPYCLYVGGNVVNIAIELNGQSPLQVYIKPSKEYKIIIRSIDLGVTEIVSTWDELNGYNNVGSAFSIPKAALALSGFTPTFSSEHYKSLEDQLKAFGSGIEITLLAAIPAGSGLGTSSILAATVLGTISDFCGLGWDKNEIGNRTLILEQLLTTGGGWQDQYGGILHGIKLLQTVEGFNQSPSVRWLPESLFNDEHKACQLLYYTGITRTAKNILSEIVQGMFLNSSSHLNILSEMKTHALNMYDTILRGDFNDYATLVKKSWELNKALDKGTNPHTIEQIISLIKDYALGYKLPGAGGGGYLYIVAKDPEAAARIRQILNTNYFAENARFVDFNLSKSGLQISRS